MRDMSSIYRGDVVRTIPAPSGSNVYISRTMRCDPPCWMVSTDDRIVWTGVSRAVAGDVAREQASA